MPILLDGPGSIFTEVRQGRSSGSKSVPLKARSSGLHRFYSTRPFVSLRFPLSRSAPIFLPLRIAKGLRSRIQSSRFEIRPTRRQSGTLTQLPRFAP